MVALGLRDNPVAAVYSSDQLRSTQTAELVAAWHGVPVRREVALREQCHGAWQGRSARRYGPVLASAELDWAPPGGETARALLARVEEFVAVLLRIPWPAGSHIVLVSHGETIRALLAALDGGPPEAMPRRIPGNGEVRTVSVAVPGVLPVGPTRGLR
jgi:broad specificity phosphatase PhoE